jgi:hypothetical protein
VSKWPPGPLRLEGLPEGHQLVLRFSHGEVSPGVAIPSGQR